MASIENALKAARLKLADNKDFLETLDRRGLERALVFKCAALTGLRRGELAAIT